jgi:hypothetical protein
MTLNNFGLPREVIRQIYEEISNEIPEEGEILTKMFGKRIDLVLEPFQEDRYSKLKSDSFPQGARAWEFGKLSLSTKQRQNLIKALPSKALQDQLRSLWPGKYGIYKDVEQPIYYKHEKDPDECEHENLYLFSIFKKHKKDEAVLFPNTDDEISIFKIDELVGGKKLSKFKVEWIDHFNKSSALICLKKIS